MVEEKKVEPVVVPDYKIDTNTVFLLIYLMYKGNMITRLNLAHLLKIIKETDPKLNLGEYLTKESLKQ